MCHRLPALLMGANGAIPCFSARWWSRAFRSSWRSVRLAAAYFAGCQTENRRGTDEYDKRSVFFLLKVLEEGDASDGQRKRTPVGTARIVPGMNKVRVNLCHASEARTDGSPP